MINVRRIIEKVEKKFPNETDARQKSERKRKEERRESEK